MRYGAEGERKMKKAIRLLAEIAVLVAVLAIIIAVPVLFFQHFGKTLMSFFGSVFSGFWPAFIGWNALCLLVGAGLIRLFGGKSSFASLFRRGGEDTWWSIFFTSTVVTCVIAMYSDWGHGLLLPKEGGTIESAWKPVKWWLVEACNGITIFKPMFAGIADSLCDSKIVTAKATTEVASCLWEDIAIGMVILLPITFILAFKDNLGRWWKEAEEKAKTKALAKQKASAGSEAPTGNKHKDNEVTEMEVLWLTVLGEFIKDAIVYVFKKGFIK